MNFFGHMLSSEAYNKPTKCAKKKITDNSIRELITVVRARVKTGLASYGTWSYLIEQLYYNTARRN